MANIMLPSERSGAFKYNKWRHDVEKCADNMLLSV